MQKQIPWAEYGLNLNICEVRKQLLCFFLCICLRSRTLEMTGDGLAKGLASKPSVS